jgi:hypothetical protein
MKICVFNKAILVRWEEDFDRTEASEWWHIIRNRVLDLDELSKNTRRKVRRGQERFTTGPIDRRVILDEGYGVYQRAYERYTTFELMFTEAEFKSGIQELPPYTEFWGVRDRLDKRLVGFSENIVRDDACFFNTVWFEPAALKLFAAYAFYFEMSNYYLETRKVLYVSNGARNISHNTAAHEFLERNFGFRKAYAALRVMYFPGLHWIINLLYPLRRRIFPLNNIFLRKITVLLEMERIRRTF